MLAARAWREHPQRRPVWLAAAVASIAIDRVVQAVLERDDNPHFAARMLADAADAALWVGGGSADPVTSRAASLMAVPFSAEMGYRVGRRGGPRNLGELGRAVIPSVALMAAIVAARRRWFPGHSRDGLGQLGWGVLGSSFGILLGQRIHNDARRAASAINEAWSPREEELARKAGAFSIVIDEGEPDSPHSLSKELLILKGYGSEAAARVQAELEGIKEERRAWLEEHATFLGRVAPGVEIVPEGAWATPLTKSQTAKLTAFLTRHSPVRRISVADLALPGSLIGSDIEIVIDDDRARIVLPCEAPSPSSTGDPTWLAFFLGAVWKALPVVPAMGAVPWWAALPFSFADLLLALSLRDPSFRPGSRHFDSGVENAEQRQIGHLKAAFVVDLAASAAAGLTARRWQQEAGDAMHPPLHSLLGWLVLVGRFTRRDVVSDLHRQWPLVLRAIAIAAAGAVPASRNRHALDVPAIVWDAMAAVQALLLPAGIEEALAANRERLDTRLKEVWRSWLGDAVEQGRRDALEDLERVVQGLEDAVVELGDNLPAHLAASVRSRCEAARRWMTRRQS